jgi:serine/threonine protein kinase
MGTFPGTSRFHVVRALGAGGMGVVYEAHDQERDERVALKTLHHMEADALFRFKNEFRALHGIEHPNLVRLGELVEHEGVWFFTMELVEGDDFLTHVWSKDWRALPSSHSATVQGKAAPIDFVLEEIAVERAYDEPRLRRALQQLAAGVQAVHDAGKVHRDIKPSNVSVTREGRVVLMDFGLITGVEQHDRSTVAGLCGTPQYMAPEQISIGRVEPAADWYAFGVMLYEALTARLPIDGKPVDIMVDKLRLKPVPPSTIVPDVPADLEALCMDLLAIEPAARPTGPQVLARLGGAHAPRDEKAHARPSTPALIGRPQELAALEHAWTESMRGHCAQTVFVTGESGMGKSALLAAFRRHVLSVHTDAVVFEGRGYEHETIPYNVFDRVIDAVSHLLRALPPERAAELMPRHAWLLPRLFPVLARVGPIGRLSRSMNMDLSGPELRARCFGAFRELLARIADRRPLVVLLDDMQWAGRDSLMLLGEIVREPEPPPMLLVIASRKTKLTDPSAVRDELDGEWRAFPQVERLTLGPLLREDARALASDLIRRTGSTALDADAVAEDAGGHPLFLVELVRHAAALGGQTAQRPRLDDAIRARAAAVDPRARDVLGLVVVAGGRVDREILLSACELDPLTLARALTGLERARLIRHDGAIVEAFHNRVTEAVTAGLDTEQRRATHARLAGAYERVASTDRLVLARHLHEAGDVERAARTAILAASDAERGLAFDRAAELYRLALDWGSADAGLGEKLAGALVLAGRSVEAADAYVAASEASADRTAKMGLRGLAATQYARAAQFDRGMAMASEVLAHFGVTLPRSPLSALLRAVWGRLVLRLRGLRIEVRRPDSLPIDRLRRVDLLNELTIMATGADTLIGTWFSTRALIEALRLGEPSRLARSLGFEAAWLSGSAGGTTERVERLKRLVAEMDAQIEPRTAWPAATVAIVDFNAARFPSALEKMREARAIFAAQPGTRFEVAMVDAFQALTLHFMGRIGELRALGAASLKVAADEGDRYHGAFYRVGAPNAAGWLAPDQPDRAAEEARIGLASWSRTQFDMIAFFAFIARTEIALYRGAADEAWSEIERSWKPLRGAMVLFVPFLHAWTFDLRGRAALARASADTSRRTALVAEALRAARALEAKGAPTGAERARLLRAGVAALRGDAEKEKRELEAAIPGFEALSMGLQANVARRRLGVLRGGDAGKTLVSSADEWMRAQQIARPDRWSRMLAPRP